MGSAPLPNPALVWSSYAAFPRLEGLLFRCLIALNRNSEFELRRHGQNSKDISTTEHPLIKDHKLNQYVSSSEAGVSDHKG
jgi:hypothetical protein